ncbi:MAG: BatA domain-containing protein, partial [Planctomycetes bacterium]|nr:BatA domain-containing protein [Planctomycetota bacterium]
MLSAAHPAALAGLAALPILWWLHRARLRPQERPWPSLLLWKRLPPPAPAAVARFRRRANLALLLALAAAASLTVGAAGLSWETRRPEPPRVAVVLDATASARGAFEALRADADAFVASLPPGATVDLAVVPGGAWAGLSAAEARARLASAVPTDAPGDPAAAAARFARADLVAAFSDRPGASSVAVWRVHPVPADARAVAALSVSDGEALAVVRSAPGRVAWTARVDGEERAGELEVPASGFALLRISTGGAREVSLSLPPDGFPSNDARYWLAGSTPVAVGLAGRDLPALRRALEGAGLRPTVGAPPQIWIGEVPDAAPAGPAILIDPPKSVPGLFDLGEAVADPRPTIPEPDDPLVRTAARADLASLTAARATRLHFAREAHALVDPLIFRTGDTLVLAFDPSPANSNWTGLVAFPLFWADAARLFNPAPTRT